MPSRSAWSKEIRQKVDKQARQICCKRSKRFRFRKLIAARAICRRGQISPAVCIATSLWRLRPLWRAKRRDGIRRGGSHGKRQVSDSKRPAPVCLKGFAGQQPRTPARRVHTPGNASVTPAFPPRAHSSTPSALASGASGACTLEIVLTGRRPSSRTFRLPPAERQ